MWILDCPIEKGEPNSTLLFGKTGNGIIKKYNEKGNKICEIEFEKGKKVHEVIKKYDDNNRCIYYLDSDGFEEERKFDKDGNIVYRRRNTLEFFYSCKDIKIDHCLIKHLKST